MAAAVASTNLDDRAVGLQQLAAVRLEAATHDDADLTWETQSSWDFPESLGAVGGAPGDHVTATDLTASEVAISKRLYAARRHAHIRRARTVALLITLMLADFLATATVLNPLLRGTDIVALFGSFTSSYVTLLHFILLIATPTDAGTRDRSAVTRVSSPFALLYRPSSPPGPLARPIPAGFVRVVGLGFFLYTVATASFEFLNTFTCWYASPARDGGIGFLRWSNAPARIYKVCGSPSNHVLVRASPQHTLAKTLRVNACCRAR